MTGSIDKIKGNIFIVEDTPDNLLLITTILREHGYNIRSAKTGRDALASIIESPPDLVILDIKMPDMDGFEICSILKENPRTSSIPVIFLSALTQISEKQKGFAVGGVDYITKPFNIQEVLKRVQIQIENSLLRAKLEQQAIELQRKNDQLQLEITEHKLATEKLTESVGKLEESKKAALNLLEDIKIEIEQRKKSEESALENEQRFREYIENASDIVYSLSLDGIFTYISPNQPGNAGDFATEGIGKLFESVIHPDDVHLCREFLSHILLTGERSTSADFRTLQKDGSTRWFSTNSSILRDKDGNNTGFIGIARDVTERKLVERALMQSEEKFRNAFLTSPDSVNINRMSDGRYVQINKGFTQTIGYTEEDALGKTSAELNIWKNPAEREKLVKGLQEKGYVENLESEFNTKSGEVRFGLMSAAVMDLDGEPHILSITRDITERNSAQEEIRKIGRHYQALIENAPDGIALIDAEGKFAFVSPSAKKMFGYDVRDELSKGPHELTHPDDLNLVVSELNKLFADPSYSPTIQYRFAEKSGNWRWIESTFTNLLSDPSVRAIIINFRDINERKITEDALIESERLLSESQTIAGLGSYVWNISTGFWKSSVVLDGIFGINKEYERSLEGWSNIVHPMCRKSMSEYVLNEVVGKHLRFDREYKILRQDNGEERWVHGLGEIEKDSVRNQFSLIGTIKDITLQKNAEEEILKLNAELEERVKRRTEQLEASNKELEAFSYSVSHDLRAPLRHINGFINLFLENKSTQLSEEELGYLTTVINSANEMGKLIDALLIFSRLNRAELQKTTINTKQLLEAGIQFFSQDIKERNIEIKTGTLFETYADLQLIRQVWTNLLSNSIKYTSKKEKAIIEIESQKQDKEIIFCIKDNGAGFDMKYADKLFGVFQRLHKPRDFEGVGIGLANVNRIVTRHGGRCWAEGEVGKGASFYFSLPLA